MLVWERLKSALGERRRRSGRLVIQVDGELLALLGDFARQDQRPLEAVARDLLAVGAAHRRTAESSLIYWQGLSPREQQVAALVCSNFTNRQIAARLGISQETVKSHVHNLLAKFSLRTKVDLRQLLSDWDFKDFV